MTRFTFSVLWDKLCGHGWIFAEVHCQSVLCDTDSADE